MTSTQISESTHERFMRVVRKELEAAEKRENKFLTEERQERAPRIKLTEQETARAH